MSRPRGCGRPVPLVTGRYFAFISADGTEAVGTTFWEQQEDVETYGRTAYEEVRKALEPFMAGTPELNKYRVTTSTVHAMSGAN